MRLTDSFINPYRNNYDTSLLENDDDDNERFYPLLKDPQTWNRTMITFALGYDITSYAKLKFESGVHRVQRVPDTEASGRIHTSAATVAVLPEVEDVEINIEEIENNIKKLTFENPNVFNAIMSLLSLSFINTTIDEIKRINGIGAPILCRVNFATQSIITPCTSFNLQWHKRFHLIVD